MPQRTQHPPSVDPSHQYSATMKAVCLLVAFAAMVWAHPGHLEPGFKINHNDRGGDGHKHEFFSSHGHGDDGHKHKATSFDEITRKDSKDHEVHIKAHPEYHYGFKVADDKHHDYKEKHEERDGHKVKGSYSLLEPDLKTVRVVEYTADKKEGFNAKVLYKPHH